MPRGLLGPDDSLGPLWGLDRIRLVREVERYVSWHCRCREGGRRCVDEDVPLGGSTLSNARQTNGMMGAIVQPIVQYTLGGSGVADVERSCQYIIRTIHYAIKSISDWSVIRSASRSMSVT